MNEHYHNLNKLFELDNIHKILYIGSDKLSLNYLIEKYPNAMINAIVYPEDNIKKYSNNMKDNYKLIKKDICKDTIDENYDLVLVHLLLGESTKLMYSSKDLLHKILDINSKYFLIYDYKEAPKINYDYFHNYIKEHDFAYIDNETFLKTAPQEFEDFIGENYYACLIRRITIVDIVFRFINGYIKIGNLTEKLRNLKLNLYTEKQQADIKTLIDEIESLTEIEKLISNDTNTDKIIEILLNNETYLEIEKEMPPKDLLLMISNYICSPKVPHIDQEMFDEMAEVAMKYNAKEKLWRLAFNYQGSNKNLDAIVDYFIRVKDSWYLSELVYAVGSDVNIKKLIKKLLNEKDKEFVKKFLDSTINSGEIDEGDIKLLKEKIGC